ncbi:MAG: AAA family ATPase [Kiritimatiellia bacterium]
MEPTPRQRLVLDRLRAFLEGRGQIFILKGYAGTGKTTPLRFLFQITGSNWQGRPLFWLSPTGRAAKILNLKLTQGSPPATVAKTIHRGIYDIPNRRIEYAPDEDGSEVISRRSPHTKIVFPLQREQERLRPIVIADEASMISSKCPHEAHISFVSDNLPADLMAFSGLEYGGQIIFVGDDAQLPPVGDNLSAALSETFFREQGLRVTR